MKAVSFFSGIGGLDLAAEWAGIQTVAQVEIDPFCQRVLAHHWPGVKRYGDICSIWGDEFGPVDLFYGGFPCQGNSLAGKRWGRDDHRNLWPEYARVIRTAKPTWILGENVRGLLSANIDSDVNDSGLFGDILRDLAECGYDAWWRVLSAADVGAPHRRERIAIVAHLANTHQHSGRRTQRTGHHYVASPIRPNTGAKRYTQRDAIECGSTAMVHAIGQRCNGFTQFASGNDINRDKAEWEEGTGWPEQPDQDLANTEGQRQGRLPVGSEQGESIVTDDGENKLANSRSKQCTGWSQLQARWDEVSPGRDVWPNTCRCGVGLADTDEQRLQEWHRVNTASWSCPTADRHAGDTGQTQPGVGLSASRVPAELAGYSWPGWPARPGQEQHDYEPPRTTTTKGKDRAARLKALGNAVVPQQFYGVFAAIVAAQRKASAA